MGLKTLIVDHNVEHRQALGSILETLGHGSLFTEHGWDALEQLEYLSCDLAFVDLFNPRMEGIEAIMTLRARHPRLVLVAMTGGWRTLRADEMLVLAREAGADATLRKPFETAAIKAALEKIQRRDPDGLDERSIHHLIRRDDDRSRRIRSAKRNPFRCAASDRT